VILSTHLEFCSLDFGELEEPCRGVPFDISPGVGRGSLGNLIAAIRWCGGKAPIWCRNRLRRIP
jgi:hypothetical protein